MRKLPLIFNFLKLINFKKRRGASAPKAAWANTLFKFKFSAGWAISILPDTLLFFCMNSASPEFLKRYASCRLPGIRGDTWIACPSALTATCIFAPCVPCFPE